MKYLKFIASCTLYVIVLIFIYSIHINYFYVEVILYGALMDAFIAAVLTYLIAFVFSKKWFDFLQFERWLILAIWLLGGYAFSISFPAVLDRSLSFYVLEKIQARGGVIHVSEIEKIFLEYIPEVRLVDVRLTEQLQSKTIVRTGDCINLTDRGQKLAYFSQFVRQNLLAKHRLLDGVYTDALTRGIYGKPEVEDQRCK